MSESSGRQSAIIPGRLSYRQCELLPPAVSQKARTRLLEALGDLSANPVLAMDCSLLVVAANAAARRLLDMDELALPVPAEAFFTQDALERIVRIFSVPALTSTAYFITDVAGRDGRKSVCVKAHRLINASGKTIGVGLTLAASQADVPADESSNPRRIEALGLYAAGVIHEFNNLIAVIAGRAGLGLAADGPAAKDRALANVMKAAQRAEHVVKDLLIYVEKREPEFVRADLKGAVLDALSLLGMELAAGYIEVVHRLEDLPPVVCDPVQISQVCFNLVRNAKEAMPEGGCVEITLSQQGLWAVITVRDHGVGIPEDIRTQIFEPFVSYGKSGRPRNSGTGLGLFVVREIIMAHGGDICVESAVARGSTFTVRIPLMPDTPAAKAAERQG